MHAVTPSPHSILDIGCGYRASKVLLSAIELDVFTILSEQPLAAAVLAQRIAIQDRGAENFFGALVALGLLTRDDAERYATTADSSFYLDRRNATDIG
jgi:hypothetical protein